ncbi:uncharacterized protein LOC144102100 [Amblyomma americanum]
MASSSVLFLAVAVLWAAAVMAEDNPEPRGRYPPHGGGYPSGGGGYPSGGGGYPSGGGGYPGGHYPRPCQYRCSLRGCDQFQCHYKCVRGVGCAALGELDARKGLGAEITVSKPLKEKVAAFDYVPK